MKTNSESEKRGTLTDVPGVEVGHWTSAERPTGCTVVLVRDGAVAGVDVRGGAPGTRETDLLRPESTVEKVHAVCLSGGSAYGLAAADGVMAYLEEQGVGFRLGSHIVPIVPAAILFDLDVGDGLIRPDREAGRQAAAAASSGPVAQGNVGAGAGATVGKLLGRTHAMKGGIGSASIQIGNGIVVGALAAVNALGDVTDPDTGEILAGAIDDKRRFLNSAAILRASQASGDPLTNTTLVVVAVNVGWTKAQANTVAQMAHDGLARAIRPAHLPFDGDTVFALGVGGPSVDAELLGRLGAAAAEATAWAIVAAVEAAEAIEGRLARRDLG